jgi:sugar phosphate isomerase/epimerase
MKLFTSNLPSLGIAHFTVIDVEPLALVDLAYRTGFQAIGLRLHPAFPGAPFYVIPVGSLLMRTMKAKLADTGLKVYDVEFVVLDEKLQIESLATILESAAELGAKRLSVCGDIADHEKMVSQFVEICQLAAKFDMGVDIETMVWRKVSSLEIAASVVHDAAQKNGGILVDALHLSRSGGTPESLRALP